MKITFEQLTATGASNSLEIEQWLIEDRQSWGVFSAHSDIGAMLGDLLADVPVGVGSDTSNTSSIEVTAGSIHKTSGRVAQVSLAEQQRLLALELANDDSDFLDYADKGTTVAGLIFAHCHKQTLTDKLLEELDLVQLQQRGFRELSTGETRRVMLAIVLASEPDFLVLDNPYSGLDISHRKSLTAYLSQLDIQMMVIFSREEDMPTWIDQIAIFSHSKLDSIMDKASWEQHPVISQITAQSKVQSEQMLAIMQRHRHQSPFDNPIFELKNGKVAYSDKTIFTEVNWRIDKGQHWQVKGPNGCGKSTLLGLIFGDHPQCYSNDIHIFGKQRGTGESIWEIKQHIGMVSSALHLQYRVGCSAKDVILSGFYDSIGLYQKATQAQQDIAQDWLSILHMSHYAKVSFKQLDYSQQRLLLIARALVKQPTLLILDEPYQGLDYLGIRLVKNTLELIARENLSQLLYVSHYHEDSLDSINNYLEFVADAKTGGYKALIS
ncbi:ATP-binding cassette domain-containing protein [Shewanella sp. 6_MG-2023]|uniref:ATP-binding cassette domain-containing protein n=1 Tax=Shewanella sp. 6_MG-2023 TaxID=3062660 RepID=UPI0026E2BFBC|nr:ATP-binding cassette domain-containing protein [Shewanella sp. 6_MG-2023]MDO6618430.1 ATP-binding cassette domain-containing protein [Shewanella sp. 6_MG-2023]